MRLPGGTASKILSLLSQQKFHRQTINLYDCLRLFCLRCFSIRRVKYYMIKFIFHKGHKRSNSKEIYSGKRLSVILNYRQYFLCFVNNFGSTLFQFQLQFPNFSNSYKKKCVNFFGIHNFCQHWILQRKINKLIWLRKVIALFFQQK